MMNPKSKLGELSRREVLLLAGGATLGLNGIPEDSMAIASAEPQAATHGNPPTDIPPVPVWRTELKELAPGVYVYTQQGGPGIPNLGLSNAACIVGDTHWTAIDSLSAPLQTKAFIAAANKATGKEPGRLVNSHHHTDHTNGNQYFLPIEIISHEFCRDTLIKRGMPKGFPGEDVPTPAAPGYWPKREGWANGTEERKMAIPITTFKDQLTYRDGSHEIQFIFMGPAHTYGDIVAYLPEHKILFAADIFFNYVVPFTQEGHVTKWIEAIDRIEKMDVEVIVPGHGPVGTKKELLALREYFVYLKSEAKKRYDAHMTPGQAAADINMGTFATWAGPEHIVMNVVRCYAEFSGTLTPNGDSQGTKTAMEEYNSLKSKRAM